MGRVAEAGLAICDSHRRGVDRCFSISFVVADSKSSDIGGESVFRIDETIEWVSCQAQKTKQIRAVEGGRSVSPERQINVINECHIPSSTWVLCTDEEISKLSNEELASFQSSNAQQISRVCRERLATPTSPTANAGGP